MPNVYYTYIMPKLRCMDENDVYTVLHSNLNFSLNISFNIKIFNIKMFSLKAENFV